MNLWRYGKLLSGERSDEQDRTRCVIEDKSRNMPDGSRPNLSFLPIFRAGTDNHHVGSPFGGCIDDLALRPSLSLHAFRIAKVTPCRAENILCRRLFGFQHLFLVRQVMRLRSEKALADSVHVTARPGIDHMSKPNVRPCESISVAFAICAELVPSKQQRTRMACSSGCLYYNRSHMVNAPASNMRGVTTRPTLK